MHVASWSQDPSTQCGAVLVRPDKTLASLGFNGFPQGVSDAPELYGDRVQKYARIVHSEMNALLFAQDESLVGCSVYAWPMPPCDRCTAHLIQSGIARMVCPPPSEEKLTRWRGQFDRAHEAWITSGAQVDYKALHLADNAALPPSLVLEFPEDTKKWDARFLRLAAEVASWSRDPREPRGAVLVRPDRTVASVGFNGFPKGLPDDPFRYQDMDWRGSMLIDAELNALVFARDRSLAGYMVYAWPTPPDVRTIAHLVQKKIGRIVSPVALEDQAREVWRDGAGDFSLVPQLLA